MGITSFIRAKEPLKVGSYKVDTKIFLISTQIWPKRQHIRAHVKKTYALFLLKQKKNMKI